MTPGWPRTSARWTDPTSFAWNDTFVHPDSAHWLVEDNHLTIPGLAGQIGLGARTDIGVYAAKNPGAGYGFYGADLQHAIVGGNTSNWNASARADFTKSYGPEDLDFVVSGAEFVASRTLRLLRWATVAPYVEVSGYVARLHEQSSVVRATTGARSARAAQSAPGSGSSGRASPPNTTRRTCEGCR